VRTAESYANGFAIGERRAFKDRGRRRQQPARYPGTPPSVIRNEWQRGYWDGYVPRSDGWRRAAC
jgi:hypothetical protein